MKKTWFVIWVVALLAVGNPASAQQEKSRCNGTFEILALYVPDFIAFKIAKGKELKEIAVYLMSETQNVRGETRAKPVDIVVGPKGEWIATYTDKTEVHALFPQPNSLGFEAKKIKFVADGREMVYDLATSEWETPN